MKTIKILLIIVFAFIAKSIDVNAQFIIAKKVLQKVDIKNIIVYIETKELSEKQIKRYDDRDLLNSIKTRYNRENELLNKVIFEHWYVNDKTEKLSDNEISQRIKNKQETWYLKLNRHTDKFFDRRVHKLKKYYRYTHYKLSLCNNKKEVVSIPLINKELSELELYFALSTIQSLIENSSSFKNMRNYTKEANANAYIIKEKTLLVSEKLTILSKEYIQLYYKGKIKISSEQEILQLIKDKDEQYAYLMLTINDFSDKPSFNHIILDCANNTALMIYKYSNANIKPCKHICSKHRYNEKPEFLFDFHFKKYEKMISSRLVI